MFRRCGDYVAKILHGDGAGAAAGMPHNPDPSVR
jgi:hypothetical protein